MVGHHDLAAGGLLPGQLGEALPHVGAALTQALPGTDRDLLPRPGAVLGGRVAIPAHATGWHRIGTGGLPLGPVTQRQHLRAQRPGRRGAGRRNQLTLLVRDPFAYPVQTRVVRPALEHRVARHVLARAGGPQPVDQAGQVGLHELALQGQRGGGDHHPGTAGPSLAPTQRRQRPAEVGQALPGAGARLYEQVIAPGRGRGNRPGHRGLFRTHHPTGDRCDHGIQRAYRRFGWALLLRRHARHSPWRRTARPTATPRRGPARRPACCPPGPGPATRRRCSRCR